METSAKDRSNYSNFPLTLLPLKKIIISHILIDIIFNFSPPRKIVLLIEMTERNKIVGAKWKNVRYLVEKQNISALTYSSAMNCSVHVSHLQSYPSCEVPQHAASVKVT